MRVRHWASVQYVLSGPAGLTQAEQVRILGAAAACAAPGGGGDAGRGPQGDARVGGRFVGGLSDPIPVRLVDGTLEADTPTAAAC
jgi:hypothetical protein